MYSIYAKVSVVNGIKVIDRYFSTRFEQPSKNDVLIKTGTGSEFINVNNTGLIDSNLCHNFKLVGKKIVNTTQEEKQKELDTIKPRKSDIEIVMEEVENHKELLNEVSEQTLLNENELVQSNEDLLEVSEQLLVAQQELLETKDMLSAEQEINNELSEYVLSLEERITNLESSLNKGEM